MTETGRGGVSGLGDQARTGHSENYRDALLQATPKAATMRSKTAKKGKDA